MTSNATTATTTTKEWLQQKNFVVFTCTWYPNASDLRLQICLQTLRECRERQIVVVVVDASGLEIRNMMRATGALVYAQDKKGGKGVALREAAQHASELDGVVVGQPSTVLCWQEAEKTDMIRHWSNVLIDNANDSSFFDIVVPSRNPQLFQETYPIEQYHSETYGNMYLDAVAAGQHHQTVDNKKNSSSFPSRIDWHFGPLAFRAQHVSYWTQYTVGADDSYDAQLVPLVHGARRGLKVVASVPVDFCADAQMKQQEQGNVAFIEKRLAQLNQLDPRVKRAWTEDFYC